MMKYEVDNISSKSSNYCILVVVWNEGERLVSQLKKMQHYASLVDIIIVDGNSTDGSTDIELLRKYNVSSKITVYEKGLCLATRMGYDYALKQGYNGIITIDGNGKDSPADLPKFIDAFKKGYDLIQGSRFMKGGHHKNTPIIRKLGVKYIMAPLTWLLSGYYFSDSTNAFRGCSRRFLLDERVQPLRSIFVKFSLHYYLNYRASILKFQVVEVPVTRVYPEDGHVPTKIDGIKGSFQVFKEFFLAYIGKYNPTN